MPQNVARSSILREILSLIPLAGRVLDLGCGDGGLLLELLKAKQIIPQGLDLKEEAVLACLEKGIPAIQADLEDELRHFKNHQYDVVILSRTLQVLQNPERVLKEIVRVGSQAIVVFPNFGHWSIRFKLLLSGRMPKSQDLPFEWYNTPNIHNLTIRDFYESCRLLGVRIVKACFFTSRFLQPLVGLKPNLLAREALFVLQQD